MHLNCSCSPNPGPFEIVTQKNYRKGRADRSELCADVCGFQFLRGPLAGCIREFRLEPSYEKDSSHKIRLSLFRKSQSIIQTFPEEIEGQDNKKDRRTGCKNPRPIRERRYIEG
jgi:hypothetical protein